MAPERLKNLMTLVVAASLTLFLMVRSDTSWPYVALFGVAALGLLMVIARRGRHTPWRSARGAIGPDHAVVLWKPGCIFCEQLLRSVGTDQRVTWVNVWVDKDANEEVRRLNGGNELTPIAVVGERVLRNPSTEELLRALSEG